MEQVGTGLGMSAEDLWRVGLIPCLCVAFYALIGQVAARTLRRVPDFEHKAEMIQGAQWAWAAVLVASGGLWGLWRAGHSVTRYEFTFAFAAPVALLILVHSVYRLTKRIPSHWFMGLAVASDIQRQQARGEQWTIAGWEERAHAQRARAARWRPLERAAVVVYLATFLFEALVIGYPLDRMMLETQRVTALSASVAAELNSPLVARAEGYPGDQDLHLFDLSIPHLGALAWQSLREITHTAPRPRRPVDYRGYHALFVKLRPGATQSVARQLAQKASQSLQRHGEKQWWYITVSGTTDHISTHKVYEPPAL